MRLLALTAMCGLAAMPALAQPQSTVPAFDIRPAVPSAAGDTGLWFVPTAETLPDGRVSVSAYRVNTDYDQGFTDVSNWPVAAGAGVGGRVELFAALTIVNRIDRDAGPDPATGGAVNEYPFVTDGWTGTNLGDLRLGAKLNLASQPRGSRAAMAIRAIVKIPTADRDTGAGTGEADVSVDAIVSREINERIELSAFGGFIVRGDPEELDLLNGFRWGFGVGLPTRRRFRLTAEVYGEAYAGRTIGARVSPFQTTGGLAPDGFPQKNLAFAAIGLTWLGKRGLFAGGGLSWNLLMKGRSELGAFGDETGDAIGLQVRTGIKF